MPDPRKAQRPEWILQSEVWREYVRATTGIDPEISVEEAYEISADLGATELVIPLAEVPLDQIDAGVENVPLSTKIRGDVVAFSQEGKRIVCAPKNASSWLAPLLQKARGNLSFFAVERAGGYVVVVGGVPGAICVSAVGSFERKTRSGSS